MEEIAMNELDIADDVYPVDNISVKKHPHFLHNTCQLLLVI